MDSFGPYTMKGVQSLIYVYITYVNSCSRFSRKPQCWRCNMTKIILLQSCSMINIRICKITFFKCRIYYTPLSRYVVYIYDSIKLTLLRLLLLRWTMWSIGLLFLFFQMSNSDSVFKDRQQLEEDVENYRQKLKKYQININLQNNDTMRILSEIKSKKEEELKNCYWFQGMNF